MCTEVKYFLEIERILKCQEENMEQMLKVTELFVYIVNGPKGEGVLTERFGETWFPFVCADRDRVESLKPYVRQFILNTGKEVKLLKFSNRSEIELGMEDLYES